MDTTVESSAPSAPGEASAVDVKRPESAIPFVAAVQQVAAARGTSMFDLVKDFAKLAFGPGRLSFDEYLALRLFDDGKLAGTDKKAFVGIDASRRIWLGANFRIED